MCFASCQRQRATTRKFGVSANVEAGFLRARSGIGQRVGRSISQHHFDALAVLHIDGSTRGRSEIHPLERESHLIATRLRKTTIGACAAQNVVDFLRQTCGCRDAHVRTTDGGRQIGGNIARHKHARTAVGV